ncbi:MAG: cation:proton antiporter [Dokdonella sp.]
MNIASLDIFHIIAALSVLVVVAHLGGFIANKFGMPPMVGELIGGIVLGPTLFARIWHTGYQWLLPAAPTNPTLAMPTVLPVLGFCSQVGLLLLLFIGGLQLRRLVTRQDAKAVSWIGSLGVLLPVGAGLLAFQFINVDKYAGTSGSIGALKIVLLIALAITSIPVITRIFLDLGLMNTRLARTVLSIGVLEDVMLYIALSIALGLANTTAKADASIPAWLHMKPDSAVFIGWHIAASFLLLATAAWGFGKVRAAMPSSDKYNGVARLNYVARRSPLGWTFATLLIITGVAMLLGLAPMLGALVAGIVASNNTDEIFAKAHQQIEAIGTSFFIPIYFALIGVSLDLVKDFNWQLTTALIVFGTGVKYGGAMLGALVAGEKPAMANALAISVNARGGPGLVVASAAFAAGIINVQLFTSMVLLAIITSVGAGIFLARVMRTNPATAELIRGDALEPATAIATAASSSDVATNDRNRTLTPA